MTKSMPGFNPYRLKQAREFMGLSINALARMTGISKQSLSAYEMGGPKGRKPTPDVVLLLAQTLNQPLRFFVKPSPSFKDNTVFYRSLSRTTDLARDVAEIQMSWMREVFEYLSRYIAPIQVNFPQLVQPDLDPADIPLEAIEGYASQLRHHWMLGEKPIKDLFKVLELNGFITSKIEMENDALSGLSLWALPEQRPFILVNSGDRSPARTRYDLAHELGHMVLHRHVTQAVHNRSEQFKLIETQAYRFAAAFLLPKEAFMQDLRTVGTSLDALKQLKPKWQVSIKAMIHRLGDLGLATKDQQAEMYKKYVNRGWYKLEPYDELALQGTPEGPFILRRMLQLVVERGIERPETIEEEMAFKLLDLTTLTQVPMSFFEPEEVDLPSREPSKNLRISSIK